MKLGDGKIHSDLIMNVVKNNLLIKEIIILKVFLLHNRCSTWYFNNYFKGQNGESYNIANPRETFKVIELAKLIKKSPIEK